LVSALLFGAVWGIFQVNIPWTEKARGFIAQALSEEMNFGAVAVWYEETFHGAPSFIPIFGNSDASATKVNTSNILYVPVNGTIVAPFTEESKGVRIAAKTEAGTQVVIKSMEAGQIKEVSQTSKEGISVTIQHANQTVSIYSGLEEVMVKQNDWVQGGQQVGVLSATADEPTSQLYFAIKKGNQYIDPTEVISFD
jgi:stage IV sporulation protein FA